MCGRFTLTRSWEEIAKEFLVAIPENIALPQYNAAPGQQLGVISSKDPHRFQMMHWGFPANMPGKNQLIINAREDTLKQRPMFSEKIHSARCIIPADGFYEWEKQPAKKQPYRFILKDHSVFAFAGLFGVFRKDDDGLFQAFTIITTQANELVAKIHNRMPVILSREKALKWLKQETGRQAEQYLKPMEANAMMCYKVSPKVNHSINNYPELIQPWTDPGLTLF